MLAESNEKDEQAMELSKGDGASAYRGWLGLSKVLTIEAMSLRLRRWELGRAGRRSVRFTSAHHPACRRYRPQQQHRQQQHRPR